MARTNQTRKIQRLARQGFTPQAIAQDMGLPVDEVRGILAPKHKGKPKRNGESEREIAFGELNAALTANEPASVRLSKVRCVLSNFGPILGMAIADADKLVKEVH